jgi:glucose-1-phosphatase
MAITHILFDLGNVLVALNPIPTGAAMCPALLSAKETIKPIVEDFECGRISTADFLEQAPQQFGLSIATHEVRAQFQSIVGEWYTETEPILKALRARYHLGCLSNTNALHIEALRERGPHLDLLHDCFFSHEIGCMKPSPTAYKHVLGVWKVPPDQILFLDDRSENVIAASNIGMQALHVFGPDALTSACAHMLSGTA